MKNLTRKGIIIALSLAIAVSMMPVACFGAQAKMPSKFDLRDKGVVTPVKFQNPWGTCWGFASIAAAETNILSDTGKTYKETKLDLSEKHLAWFSLNHISDPNNSQNGEGHYSTYDQIDKYPWACLGDGAEGFYATTMFASGIGPVYEKDYPYTNKGGVINWRKVNEDGSVDTKAALECPGEGYERYCYTDMSEEYGDKTSWAIDDSERFKQKFELEESCMLPTPAKKNEDGSYSYNKYGTLAIKSQLLKGNAVQIGFFADVSKPDQKGEAKYLNNNTWAHYTYEPLTPNHSVCIVGYDDNYSKDNFNSEHKPPKNGAWIVKNSWGSALNKFPNKGKGNWGVVDDNGNNTGYFYLSYYDQTLERPETFDFYTGDKASKESYHYVDEYDFMPVYFVGNKTVNEDVRMMNVFTAEADEMLRAVSCQTATQGCAVTYRVYLMDDGQSLADVTEPETTQMATYEWGGYHREDLEEPVKVKAGQRYAVEIEVVTPSGKHEMAVAKSYGEGSLNDEGKNPTGDRGYVVGVINEGESILCTEDEDGNRSFEDLTEVVKKLDAEDGGIYAYDNFAIKGYANPILKTPAKTKITSAKTYKGKHKVKIGWKKVSAATGYQIAYKKAGAKKWTKVNVGKSKTSKTFTKLKKGKKYSFKVRTYIKYERATKYSGWSKIRGILCS